MEQLFYTVAASHGGPAGLSGAGYLHLLETRLAGLAALAESLTACRPAFAHSKLDAIMQSVEMQSAHCNEVARAEQGLAHYVSPDSTHLPDFLSPVEAQRANELLRRTAALKQKIQQLNRTYAGLVRKAAHNNAVLRNLYATALVYADPRVNQGASCAGSEE
jgi:hypothetical protein